MPYFRSRIYTADAVGGVANSFAQRISSEIAEAVDNSGTPAPAFGWTTDITGADINLPHGISMRTVDLVSLDGTKRRRVYIGKVANASLWNDPSLTVDLQDALGNTVTYTCVGRSGEKRRFPQGGAY